MEVLIKPQISEKSMSKIASGKYVFVVNRRANKPQIAKAIEDLYKVKVVKVNVINVKGGQKIIRGRLAMVRPWGKAVVTLKKGQKIPGFEEK